MAKKKKTRRDDELFLLDDPGGTPLEWLEVGTALHTCARHLPSRDPWERHAPDDAVTEHRRRKLQHLSLDCDEDRGDETGSAA